MPKCKICQAKFKPKYNSIEKWCGPECAVEYLRLLHVKKIKKEKREFKIKDTKWDKKLQTEVQKIARYIDVGLPCLARGHEGQIHGGHVYSKGGYKEMRFNLHNIHRQSAQSNHFQNDDGKMRDGIEMEYGIEYLEFIKSLIGKPIPKFTNEEYREKFEIAKSISKMLYNKGPFDLKTRIDLRNQANKTLGIYDEPRLKFKINI